MTQRANSLISFLGDETPGMALSERVTEIGTRLLVTSKRLLMFATVKA